jgi:hypothetical protein
MSCWPANHERPMSAIISWSTRLRPGPWLKRAVPHAGARAGLNGSAVDPPQRSTVTGSSARSGPRQFAGTGRAITAEQPAQRLQPGRTRSGGVRSGPGRDRAGCWASASSRAASILERAALRRPQSRRSEVPRRFPCRRTFRRHQLRRCRDHNTVQLQGYANRWCTGGRPFRRAPTFKDERRFRTLKPIVRFSP